MSTHRSQRDREQAAELDELLERISYETTTARSAGIDRADDLREALRRLRDLVAETEALAADIEVRRSQA